VAHLFSSNNVQCLFSDEVGATSSDDSSNRIRTATHDGDRAVGVNLVRLHRTRSASVKMFSCKGIIVIQISIVQNKFDKHDSLYTQFELGFIL
jgi:hypothetical protein